MKKLIMIVSVCFSTSLLHAQLKVKPTGYVGIGGINNPLSQLHINGNMRSTYNGQTLVFVHNPGPEIGSSTDQIEFWYSGVGHNVLKAQKFEKMSDSTTKTNIVELENGLEIIMQLESYSYNIKESGTKEYGFLSQEVRELLPTVTDSSKGLLLMDYDQIIPFLVAGMQEQQKLIVLQDSILKNYNERITSLEYNESNSLNISEDNDGLLSAVLHQNAPNPFRKSTTIKYDLPESYSSANIMIFDLKGTLLKNYPITDRDSGETIIEGRELKAGMYLYSLIVDDKEIDTKKMILQK